MPSSRSRAPASEQFCKTHVAFSAITGGRNVKRASLAALFVAVFAACASTKTVDMTEPRRIVGTENDVRIDAEVFGDTLGPNVNIPIKYDITNHRPTTILVADLLLQATYD